MPSLETANVGKAVAARVGSNIREVRTKLGMTQAQLAAPEFSISYISAIEGGKIRPSLKALSILAHRLDVPLTFLLEGSPAGVTAAQAVGYSPADAGPDPQIELDLTQAYILLQQYRSHEAIQLLAPLQAPRITTRQAYRLYFLRGAAHLMAGEYQEAVIDLRSAFSQAESLQDVDATEHARNLLGQAYYALHHDTLALEHHLRGLEAIDQGQVNDPFFSLAVFSSLANDYLRLNKLELATSYYHRALALLENLGHDSRQFAQKYLEVSRHFQSVGKLTLAQEYALQSQAVYEMRHEQGQVGLLHLHLGRALEMQGNMEAAEIEYQLALRIQRMLIDEVATSQCLIALAEILLKGKKTEEAAQAAQEALQLAQASCDPLTHGQACFTLAMIRDTQGNLVEADHCFAQALTLLERSNSREVTATAYFRYATLLEQRGDVQGSLTAIRHAYDHQLREKHGACCHSSDILAHFCQVTCPRLAWEAHQDDFR